MSKIRIRNFGPIKDGYLENDRWIDIKKVTVLIGNQGSGKSTVAKLISTFLWIEKALIRGDYEKKWFERADRLKTQFFPYHRLENYLTDNTEIEFNGNAYRFKYKKGNLNIDEITNNKEAYSLPQIMYVPAERNFIANIKSPKELKLSSDSLREFLTEFDNAKDTLKNSLNLPINHVDLEYDRLNDTLNVKGEDYKLKLTEASSGFQSFVPLYLVSEYLAHSVKNQSENKEPMSSEEIIRFKKGVAEIWSNEDMTDEQKRVALSVLSSKFNKTSFINIVEEPEQNLFPSSQWEMLLSLLKLNNYNFENKLLLTTHSPYIINDLSLVVKGRSVQNKIQGKTDLMEKLNNTISRESLFDAEELNIYELDDKKGAIKLLDDYQGLPSDENYLNLGLADTNETFERLLEIEDLCQ